MPSAHIMQPLQPGKDLVGEIVEDVMEDLVEELAEAHTYA